MPTLNAVNYVVEFKTKKQNKNWTSLSFDMLVVSPCLCGIIQFIWVVDGLCLFEWHALLPPSRDEQLRGENASESHDASDRCARALTWHMRFTEWFAVFLWASGFDSTSSSIFLILCLLFCVLAQLKNKQTGLWHHVGHLMCCFWLAISLWQVQIK